MKARFCCYYFIQPLQVWKHSWRCLCAILLLIGSLTTVTSAQTKLWDKTFGGDGYDDLYSLQQTQDGGYILGGYSFSGKSGDKTESSKGYNDYWIVKLKADGTKEWDKAFGGDYSDDLVSLQQTSDGGYILGGTSFSGKNGDKTEANEGHSDYWIMKLKADGSKEWDKTFGGNGENYLSAIQQTSDNGFILGGYSSSGKSGDKTEDSKGGFDFWVIKLKANGTKEWDKSLGGNNSDLLYSLQQTRGGGYILGGASSSGKSGDKTQINKGDCADTKCSTADYWVVKLSATGTKEWDKAFGGDDNDKLRVLQQTYDGGYILGGHSQSGKSGDKTEASKGATDYWIVKLKADGTREWDKAYGGNNSDYLYSLQQVSNGGYILGGTSSSDKSGDKTEAAKGNKDYWVVKLSASGTKEWDKTLGGDGENYLSVLQQTSDGDYVLGGTSSSGISGEKTQDSKGGFDFWIVKLTEERSVTAQWDMRYGGTGKDNFTTMIKTNDGGYLSGGFTNSAVSGDKSQNSKGKNDYWIVKSDKNGKKLWEKSYGGSGEDYLNNIIQTADGGFLLAGSSLSGISGDKMQASRGDRDYWVVKVDKQGAKEWDKRYGGSGIDELKQVRQLPSGSYVLAGTSNSPASGDITQATPGGNDYWIIKISPTGTRIWNKRFGGAQDENLEGLVFTGDGGFLLGGTSASSISGDKTQATQGGSDYWLVRITGAGEKIWDQRYGGSGDDKLLVLGSADASTGNFFVAGTSGSGKSGDKSQPSQGGKDYWLLKINGNGKKLWDQRYGGGNDDELRTTRLTQEGGYLLGGSSTSGVSGNKSQASQGASDFWLVKTSATGILEWDSRFGGSNKEELRSIVQTNDGGYLLGGRSDSGVSGDRTQLSQGSTDYWLIKVIPEKIPLLAAREITLPEESSVKPNLINLQAYPNPFSQQATVNLTLPETQTATLKVYDSQGREVAILFQGEAKARQTYEVNWQAGNKSAGMYFLQLQTSTKSQQLKLLLTK